MAGVHLVHRGGREVIAQAAEGDPFDVVVDPPGRLVGVEQSLLHDRLAALGAGVS